MPLDHSGECCLGRFAMARGKLVEQSRIRLAAQGTHLKELAHVLEYNRWLPLFHLVVPIPKLAGFTSDERNARPAPGPYTFF
jgi:hypothetical protein